MSPFHALIQKISLRMF